MVVVFCSTGGWCCSGWWMWDLRTFEQFQVSERSQCKIWSFGVFGVKSRELRGRVSLRFSCVTPVIKSFSWDLLQVIINYLTETHLESCQTSTVELFYGNSQQPKDINYFRKKFPPQLLDWIPNASLERCYKCGV